MTWYHFNHRITKRNMNTQTLTQELDKLITLTDRQGTQPNKMLYRIAKSLLVQLNNK